MSALLKPLIAEANGRCVSCDGPLPPVKPHRHTGGRPRSVLCGDADCLRVYHQMLRSRARELVAIGLLAEMKAAAKAIRRANRSLRRRA